MVEAFRNRGKLIMPIIGIASVLALTHGIADAVQIRSNSSSATDAIYPDVTDSSVAEAWRVVGSVEDQYNDLFKWRGNLPYITGRGSIDDFQKAAASQSLTDAHTILVRQKDKWRTGQEIEESAKPFLLRAGEPLAGLIGLFGVGLFWITPRRIRD